MTMGEGAVTVTMGVTTKWVYDNKMVTMKMAAHKDIGEAVTMTTGWSP